MTENIEIGVNYEFEFAGDIKKGELVEIKTLYEGTVVYVLKSKENNRSYPVQISKIIKKC